MRLLFATILCVTAGCHAQQPLHYAGNGAMAMRDTIPFPATTPDSVPAAVRDSLSAPGSVLRNAPSMQGRVIRDLIAVVFVDSTPPDSVPRALFHALGTIRRDSAQPDTYLRGIVVVSFNPGTSLADRQSAIDSVGGVVVGGHRFPEERTDGDYYVRIAGDTWGELVHAVLLLQGLPQVGMAATWPITTIDESFYRRPVDGPAAGRRWHSSAP